MIDTAYLQNLLAILKTHQVKHIKMQGLELSLHGGESRVSDITPIVQESDSSTQIIADALKKQEQSLPPDLRADSLMDYDKILSWSSPDQKPFEEEPELPLTGEMPL